LRTTAEKAQAGIIGFFFAMEKAFMTATKVNSNIFKTLYSDGKIFTHNFFSKFIPQCKNANADLVLLTK